MNLRALTSLPAVAALLLASACTPLDAEPNLPPDLDIRQAAATIAVPADFSTISAALAAAQSGDVVTVAAGSYSGNLTIPGGVILQGAGIDQTIISGQVTVTGGEAGIVSLNLVGPGATQNTVGVTVGAGNGLEIVSVRMSNWWIGILLNPGASPAGGPPIVNRLAMQNNGYGVVVQSGDAVVTNNYLAFNPRSGVYVYDNATATIINNTVFGNAFGGNTIDRDAAISLGLGAGSTIRNNIVTSNLFGVQCAGCTATIDTNNVWGNTTNWAGDASAGTANMNVDPVFVNVSGGNLRLQAVSPMIDAGSAVLAPNQDWDGLPRPSGAGVDIGADEWTLSAFTLVINEVMSNPGNESTGEWIEIANVGQDPVDLAGLIVGDGDENDTLQAWQAGTTIVPAGGFAVVLDPDYTGQYTIPGGATLVTVGNAKIGNGLSTNDPIQLRESNGYVVISEWTLPFDPGDGNSVERVDVLTGNVTSNWVVSPCGHSIGAVNCSAGVIAPNDPSTLRVTEVLANALNETTGEFVELWNSGTEDVDAAGLVVSDGDSTDALVGYQGGSTIIPAGKYAVILDPNYTAQYMIPADVILLTTGDQTIGDGIANTNDPITLFDTDGTTLIDTWTFPGTTADGQSWERVSYATGNVSTNWMGSSCPISHSAGRLNCRAGGVGDGLVLNEVMNNPINEQTGEFIELKNNGPGSVDLAGLFITDGDSTDALVAWQGGATVLAAGAIGLIIDANLAGDFTIPAGIVVMTTPDNHLGNGLSTIDPIVLLESDGVSTIDTWQAPFNAGNGFSAEKVNSLVGDTASNWLAATSCAAGSSPGLSNCASYTPIPGGTTTLVITEVMANPLDEGTGEYIEVYNDGSVAIDLWGLIAYDGDAWDFLRAFQGGSTVVGPGEYAVIVDQDYAGEYAIPAGVTVVTVDDANIGSGLATNDTVALYEADGYSQIDVFAFPFNPGNGVSAGRVSMVGADSAGNWIASPCGSSAGVANCN